MRQRVAQLEASEAERKRANETLKRSLERLENLMEEIPTGVLTTDLSGKITYANETILQGTGYSRDELVGMDGLSAGLLSRETVRVLGEQLKGKLMGKPPSPLEIQFKRKDGSWMWLEIRGKALWEEGRPVGIQIVGEDITERKRAEETLRQSERNYRILFETALEGVAVIDRETLKVVLCNQNAARVFGLGSPEEVVGLDPVTAVHPDDRERVAKIMLEDGLEKDLRETNEFRLIARDGRDLWVSAVGATTEYQGKPAMMVSFRDFTERKQAEEALRQSEERYRTILASIEDGYYEVDLAGKFTFFNDAECRQLGYPREEMMGMNYRVYTSKEETGRVYKAYNQIYRTGKPIKGLSSQAVRKDGTRVFTEDSVSPLQNQEGEIIGFRGISRDITERKRMEEEKRQLERKAQLASRLATVGEMASGIAHEINNPLTGVIGYAQLLMQRQDIPEDIKKDLKVINDGGQRVAGIVNKMLTFARQYKPQRDYVSINDLIANTLALRAYELKTHNIKVITRLDPELPATIADGGQLQQVFLNLIVNAETEMSLAHDKGRLSIKTEKIDNAIRISFKDDGPGIAKENMDKIFNPFFTTREVGEGTGLGLSMCHGIIAEHNGQIYAKSKSGKGATFIVELPIVTRPEQLELAEPKVEEAEEAAKAKILVVDDEPTVLSLVSRVLTDEGHEVETIDNADDALEMIESKRYHLILLDIQMPGMSGTELYKRIHKIAPSLARRIVFITGDVIGARTTAFLSRTKAHYIMKPFDAEQLKREVNRILTEGA